MASEPERSLIWLHPEPGARRTRFSRELIAETALAIADEEGFEAVSMRRVAARLGAGTMTLYHYVPTKEHLLQLMDDAIMGEVLVPDGELPVDDWRASVRMIAVRSRAAFRTHPWAVEGMRGAAFGPNGVRHFEQSLAAVSSLDLEAREKLALIATIDDYVFGFVFRQAEERSLRRRPDADDEEDLFDAIMDHAETVLDLVEHPHVDAVLGTGADRRARWRTMAAGWGEERFERGLDLLLDGIERDLERRGALPRRSP